MKKKIYLLFFVFVAIISTPPQAQVSLYSFAESTETYAAVVGTNITATGDDASQNALPIGFTFNFGGTDYTTFSANTNGWIRLGANMPTTGTWDNLIFGGAATTHKPLIAAFWDDNHRNTGAIAYSLSGTAPNQVLEVGWNNINIGGSGSTSATNTASFKLRIYETTSVIEFVYGPTMAAAGTLTASIGLNDNTSFLSVTPAAAATVSSATANNVISVTTDLVGKKYTFTPSVVSAELMDYVNLQFPGTASVPFGTSAAVYAQGYEPGITEAAGAGVGVQAWIGYSNTNTNPNTWINWVPATFNVQVGNNDEFTAAIGSTLAAGTYYYASRWRLGSGAFSYGGFNAGPGSNGFWDGTDDISGVLTVTPPPPPANDVCSGAIVIPGAGPFPITTAATNNAAATDTNDPVPTCQSNSHKGIWYSFTPTVTGAYTISTCQSAAPLSNITDNVISIFTSAAGCTGPFTSIGCDDDGCTTLNLQAILNNISLTAGTTYYILVYSYDINTGNVQLNISAPIACAPPTAVAVNTTTSTGTNVTWTGTGTFIVEYGLAGFTPGTGATAGAGGTVINPATSPQAISGLTAATAYQVYVRQDCSGAGNGYSANSAVVAFSTLGVPPPCTTNLTPANGATVPAPGGATPISWTPQPAATSYDIYFGTVNPPTSFIGNTALTAITITDLDYNTTYYWYVAPVNAGSPATGCATSTTSFTTGAAPAPPANDEPCAAITIGAVPLAATTISSTQNLPPLSCSGATSTSANDVWFQFTATTNGSALITLDNGTTGFADLVLQAFSGTCTALTSISCVDAFTDAETLPLTGLVAGQTYFVRVYGYNDDEGSFEISVTGAALPIAIEYFRGTKQNSKNVLDWKVTCVGSPSVTLTLERSADGRRFEG
ncbi:MAG: hypothetical protein H7Y86_07335, partial [Rhizobacter sp.]|nr:hypothetical protein [Ferruginibacter sp.]